MRLVVSITLSLSNIRKMKLSRLKVRHGSLRMIELSRLDIQCDGSIYNWVQKNQFID